MTKYSHVIEVDEQARTLNIYRLFEDGRRHLYTTVELSIESLEQNDLNDLARRIGENLLIDSPIARKLLNL